jgi:hypothetical protein
MPLSPRKCCGKNVVLTPRNIRKNCALAHRGWRVRPVRSGSQCVNAAKIAKTAPILRT